ncbi:MAG TPA: hypothetical protein VHG29_00610 [Novosphingobium sp.]|nr:hypothetical protein [Novosphingobium sp.]
MINLVFLIAFFGSLFGAFIVALFATWISSLFLPERESRIAGFAFLLGAGSFPSSSYIVDQYIVADIVGRLVGATVVWWFVFKREKQIG